MSNILCMYYSRTGNTKKAMEEIAQDLGLPLSTVLSRYNRALKKLKRYLTEEGVRL